jgi:hypothetical protein
MHGVREGGLPISARGFNPVSTNYEATAPNCLVKLDMCILMHKLLLNRCVIYLF